MKKDEKGSTLLVVLLMVLIFTVLGLSILSVSISGAKRTEIRKESIQEDLDAIKKLKETVAFIKKTVNDYYIPEMPKEEFNQIVEDHILTNPYGYKIVNTREDLKDFTRVLSVSVPTSNGHQYQQTVYITPMPSFLKYAVGSRDDLTINGSLYLKKGNIYANSNLEITNQAKYIFNGVAKSVVTSFPSVSKNDDNYMFLGTPFFSYCNLNCYNGATKNTFTQLSVDELTKAFDPTPPIFSKDDSDFVEVDIIKTFIQKLKDAGIIDPTLSYSYLSNADLIKSILNNINSSNVEIINSFNDIEASTSSQNFLYNGNAYIDTNNLSVDKSKWLVINGDAYFENSGTTPMNVSANILVTGNVYIKGDLAFNSTMYVLGNTTVDNVNISGIDNGELILMTLGKLEIAKLNKFEDPDITLDKVNSIKAFMYTNSSAVVYAIGSYININGGLFANGNLEVNVFRGKTALGDGTDLKFTPSSDEQESRLVIQNNKKLFLDQAESLPKVSHLEVLTDLMKKE